MVRMAAAVEDLKAATGRFDRLKHRKHRFRELVLCEKHSKLIGIAVTLNNLIVSGKSIREKLTNEKHHCHFERLLERGERFAIFGDPMKQPFAREE